MPAAVSENTPQEVFGRNLANRRCSERREVGWSRHSGWNERKGKPRFGAAERKFADGSSGVVTEPPGDGKSRKAGTTA